jgi:hypothetical protein
VREDQVHLWHHRDLQFASMSLTFGGEGNVRTFG